jgi:hypothetical protein
MSLLMLMLLLLLLLLSSKQTGEVEMVEHYLSLNLSTLWLYLSYTQYLYAVIKPTMQ